MKEKRNSHAVCIQGDQIIVAGGDNGLNQLDTCEAFDTKSKMLVLPHPCSASTIVKAMLIQLMLTSHLLAAGRPCRG